MSSLSLSLVSWPAVLFYPETVSSFKMSTDTVNILLVLFLNKHRACNQIIHYHHPSVPPACDFCPWTLKSFEAYFQGTVVHTFIYTHWLSSVSFLRKCCWTGENPAEPRAHCDEGSELISRRHHGEAPCLWRDYVSNEVDLFFRHGNQGWAVIHVSRQVVTVGLQ